MVGSIAFSINKAFSMFIASMHLGTTRQKIWLTSSCIRQSNILLTHLNSQLNDACEKPLYCTIIYNYNNYTDTYSFIKIMHSIIIIATCWRMNNILYNYNYIVYEPYLEIYIIYIVEVITITSITSITTFTSVIIIVYIVIYCHHYCYYLSCTV